MSKTSNKQQLQILLTLMEARPDIARGFHKGNKEEVGRFWRNAEQELNSAGPPLKNITEWKKVWTDQKKYVRHKASHNLRTLKSTGGGPNLQQPLSPTEEAIFNLLGMKESVEGVPAQTFGLPFASSSDLEPEALADDDVEYLEEVLKEEVVESIPSPPVPREKSPVPILEVTKNIKKEGGCVRDTAIKFNVEYAIR